jgi:hypothetical protein
VNARTFFQGVAAFNRGQRFRDNPYRFNDASFTDDMLSWYEGWSTAFDVTWQKLTLAQRFKLILGQSRPAAGKSKQRTRRSSAVHNRSSLIGPQ